MNKVKCRVRSCERISHGEYCHAHRQRLYKHGSLQEGIPVRFNFVKKYGRIKREIPGYNSWVSMHARCGNPKHPKFFWYGGRGITVCNRWFKFENFIEDMGLKPSSNHSIDRINGSRGYSPANCKWSTRAEQRETQRPRGRDLQKRKPWGSYGRT